MVTGYRVSPKCGLAPTISSIEIVWPLELLEQPRVRPYRPRAPSSTNLETDPDKRNYEAHLTLTNQPAVVQEDVGTRFESYDRVQHPPPR